AKATDNANPGADDIMYGGVGAQWVKFAHGLLARIYIHQSYIKSTSTNVTAMADSALAHANLSYSSIADDAQIVFGTAANNNAPWYQFNTQRADIEFAYVDYTSPDYTPFADSLLLEKDPRFSFMIDSATEPVSGDGLGAFYDGPGSSSPLTGVVELSTYAETQFISAEAVLRGATGVAQTFYSAGINASMTKLGVSAGSIATYMTGPWGVLSAVPATAVLQNAWEENIALFTSPEAWSLWRRCEWPITPTTNNAAGKVPHRFIYPQSEINLNPNSLPLSTSATQQTPAIFWDK
ncbi:MAG TPA: SusD/RagB family nutrient-binding outer membrane lipoprotein, partial [Bacteroidia bacterium]|nr:SusD/RagB family nutrient-binding outer membrane lipoprotein [Bacteroidia bacterium]